jgi:SAGA-associated factor 29
MTLDDRLESLYRENVKISEEVSHIIDGKSDEMSLLDSIKILAGLREASEESLQLSRSHSNSKGRNATLKRKAGSMDVDDDVASRVESPRPGPTRQKTDTDRLGVEGKSRERNRERSVTSTREVSVKLEDGAESVASSVEGKSSPSLSLFPPSPYHKPLNSKPQQTNPAPAASNSPSAPTSSIATKAAPKKVKGSSAASQT